MRVFLAFCLISFAVHAGEIADTNLGTSGNRWVADTFRAYQPQCNSHGGSPRRILLQGFGPFSGTSRNLSGAVVAKLAGLSQLPITANGGWAILQIIQFEGEQIEFCFVYLDVVWDLAGAILLAEIEAFNPELVVMSGIGSAGLAIAEGGVQNKALGLSGYDASGNPLSDRNTPWCDDKPCNYADNAYVLSPQDPGVTQTVSLSWDNQAFAAKLSAQVNSFAPEVRFEAPPAARAGNDYLCNNVSFIVQSALNGAAIRLAGGEVTFATKPRSIAAGFLHYPSSGEPSDSLVEEWAKAMLKVLSGH